MTFLTFKEHLNLLEARNPGVKYTEKQVKNVVDKVTATLKGSDSASMTKLAKRYARLEVSMKAMKEKHDELNQRLKGDVQNLFDAEDVVLTRVVETAQFTLTMAKEIQKSEGTAEVDYKSIIAALSVLIPDELQSKIDMITEKYTKVVPPKAPVKKLSVSKETVSEGLLERAATFLKGILSWATKFDSKLEALKRKLSGKKLNEAANKFEGFEYLVWHDENAGRSGSPSYASRMPYVVYQGGNPADGHAFTAHGRFATDKEAKIEAKRLNDEDKRKGVTKRKVQEATIAHYDEKNRQRNLKMLTAAKLVKKISDSSLPQDVADKVKKASSNFDGEISLLDVKDILRLAGLNASDKEEVMDLVSE